MTYIVMAYMLMAHMLTAFVNETKQFGERPVDADGLDQSFRAVDFTDGLFTLYMVMFGRS